MNQLKKTIINCCLIFTIFLIYFLQSNFFNWFNIAGIKPNLFIILLLVLGIFIGKIYGAFMGIIFGLLLDLFIGKVLGINAIVLCIAGILRRAIYKEFFKG